MRAAWYPRNGEAREVLEVGELPTPGPGPGEVRVKLAVSGVNPSDVKSRRARPLGADLVVPHSDGAGVIDAVGEGVSPGRIGERVWVWNGQWQRQLGTAAEFIALPEAQAVPLPDGVDFAAGACLGIPAMTAFHAVQRLGELRGRTVLVIGASSAVGHYAAQMAVLGGARVIGTVGSVAKAAHALAAGAEATIDYKREPVVQRVKELTGGRGVDAVIDMDFSTTSAWLADGLLAPHGVLVSYGSNAYTDLPVPYRVLLFGSISLLFFLVYDLGAADRLAAVDGLTRLLAAGQLAHTIGGRWPLDDIAAAHEAVEGGARVGNVVVDVG
jgi:NADPH2:quinone reductase